MTRKIESSVKKTSQHSGATFILDDADNLSAILTLTDDASGEISNDTSNSLKYSNQPTSLNSDNRIAISSIHTDKWINICKHHRLLKATVKSSENRRYSTKVREQFLALFSKDQRIPLMAILDFASLFPPSLIKIGDQNTPLKIGLETQFILDGINYLQQTIENNAPETLTSDTDLFSDINDSIKNFLPLCKKKNIAIVNNIKPAITKLVCIKGSQFKPIFQNILFNAIQCNKAGKKITIEYQEINANNIRIKLSGAGMNATEPELLAPEQPFSQINMSTYVLEGSGIGLVIANKIIEFIGGGFNVNFKPGAGNIIDLILPITEITSNKQQNIQPTKNSSSTATPFTILYIEDNESHIQLVAQVLKKIAGTSLISALTPETGLKLAASTAPVLILLDIRLPEMDGYTVFQRLQSNPATCNIPVIALSASAMPHEIKKGLRLGFKHYFTKPFHIEEFIAIIAQELPTLAQAIIPTEK
ncbi:response regulator [Gammaproteobacteria bacterium]|nr:response regulator [Gammaproteobacteria bacterium]